MSDHLKIRTRRGFSEPSEPIEGGMVEFYAEDGRTMFSVRVVEGAPAIEVRACQCCRFNDTLHDERLLILPTSSNQVTLTVEEYDD